MNTLILGYLVCQLLEDRHLAHQGDLADCGSCRSWVTSRTSIRYDQLLDYTAQETPEARLDLILGTMEELVRQEPGYPSWYQGVIQLLLGEAEEWQIVRELQTYKPFKEDKK